MASPLQFTDLKIINSTLTRMGEGTIGDLQNDIETRAIVMRENYEQVKETALTKTAWRFATVKAPLNKLSGKPINRWAAAWSLPADKLKVLFVWPGIRYELHGKRLLTNDTQSVIIDYIRLVPEGDWPPWFREFTIDSLLIATVKGITGDDPSSAQEKSLIKSENDALYQDSQQQPNQEPLPSPFIDVRF